jgi:hypothetical protein
MPPKKSTVAARKRKVQQPTSDSQSEDQKPSAKRAKKPAEKKAPPGKTASTKVSSQPEQNVATDFFSVTLPKAQRNDAQKIRNPHLLIPLDETCELSASK